MSYSLRAVRLILTNFIVFLLTWYYQVPERVWALITIWFVMFEYTNVGGVWMKSLYRFLGTSMSAIYGLTIVYFFYNNVLINMLALIPATFMYTYYFMNTDKVYIGVIGCVTLSIVLLNHNDIDAAILRTFNIILGILASMFMMRFFYPQYARDELMSLQKESIAHIAEMLETFLNKSMSPDRASLTLQNYRVELLRILNSFTQHIREAYIETRYIPRFTIYHQQAVAHLQNITMYLSTLIKSVSKDALDMYPDLKIKILELIQISKYIEQTLDYESKSMDTLPEQNIQAPSSDLASPEGLFAYYLLNSVEDEMVRLAYKIKKIVALYQKEIKRIATKY